MEASSYPFDVASQKNIEAKMQVRIRRLVLLNFGSKCDLLDRSLKIIAELKANIALTG